MLLVKIEIVVTSERGQGVLIQIPVHTKGRLGGLDFFLVIGRPVQVAGPGVVFPAAGSRPETRHLEGGDRADDKGEGQLGLASLRGLQQTFIRHRIDLLNAHTIIHLSACYLAYQSQGVRGLPHQ